MSDKNISIGKKCVANLWVFFVTDGIQSIAISIPIWMYCAIRSKKCSNSMSLMDLFTVLPLNHWWFGHFYYANNRKIKTKNPKWWLEKHQNEYFECQKKISPILTQNSDVIQSDMHSFLYVFWFWRLPKTFEIPRYLFFSFSK